MVAPRLSSQWTNFMLIAMLILQPEHHLLALLNKQLHPHTPNRSHASLDYICVAIL